MAPLGLKVAALETVGEREKRLFLHSLLVWWKLLKFPHFQNGLWRLGARAAAELLHGGASAVHGHDRSGGRRRLPLPGVPQPGPEAPGTETPHPRGQSPRADTSEQAARPPVTWATWRLRWVSHGWETERGLVYPKMAPKISPRRGVLPVGTRGVHVHLFLRFGKGNKCRWEFEIG